MNHENDMTGRRRVVYMLSIAVVLICTVVTIIASGSGKEYKGFGLGDYSEADIALAEKTYEESQDPKDLIELLKMYLYQAEVEGNDTVNDSIRIYGTKLLELAKQEKINLEEMDREDGTLLELLKLIRAYGAK